MSTLHRRAWLALIIALYLLLATLYAVSVPAWQAPDEPAHYNYIHELATSGQFPVLRMGDYDQAYLEQLKASRFPPDLSIASVRYEAHQPPLYYLLASPVFLASGGSLTALRLFSAALGALLVALVYLIGAAIFADRPHLGLGAAAFTAFLPMHVAIAASVNNDALAEVLLAAILLLAIRYLRLALVGPRLPAGRDAVVLGLLLGLALIAKVSAYVALPVVLAALLIAWGEKRRVDGPAGPALAFARHALLVFLPALLIALPWYLRNAAVYGHLDILARRWHDTVVVGQLTTAELAAQSGAGAVLERFLVWSHDSFWGVFGWMGVWLDARAYTAALAFTAAVAAGGLWQVTRGGPHRSQVRAGTSRFALRVSRFQAWALALLGLSALGTLGIYLAYNVQFVQPQGRYLFPALPLISLAVAGGWWSVARWPAAARWAALALLATAGLAALWGVTREGINKWSLLIFFGGAAALWAWSLAAPRLQDVARRRASFALYGLPFAAMAGLCLVALWTVILPQLR